MSYAEYNNLLFQISQSLNSRNVRKQLLIMCRGKVATRSEDSIQDVFSLFEELEEKGLLGQDNLGVVADILKGVEEWSLLEKVKHFESKRGTYNNFLAKIMRELDELNDLERLISICRGKIPEIIMIEVHVFDVPSLFKVLENNNLLEINRLNILKEILIELGQEHLLKTVEEFDQQRRNDEQFERRKAQAAAVVSTARATGERIIGEVGVHCTFRKISGALLVVGIGMILHKCSSLEEFVEAFTVAVLPAATALRAISEGSVCFTILAENRSALETLWERYRDGTLQRDLQNFLVTDEIIQLADGEEVMVTVYIDEKEFGGAVVDVSNVEQQVWSCRGTQEIEGLGKLRRRNSDSYLYRKVRDFEEPIERPIQPEKPDMNQATYLDQEKLALVDRYLEDAAARSVTTETSDSGMPGTRGAPSESGIEEAESTHHPFLRDLSEQVVGELGHRLLVDRVSRDRFYQSMGLDRERIDPATLKNIGKLFPDTPVKLLKDVFQALQLYDLVEILERVKPKTLRPALPLKEIAKLPIARNRPTRFYSKAAVLVVDNRSTKAAGTMGMIANFFELICPGSGIDCKTTSFPTEKWRHLGDHLTDVKMDWKLCETRRKYLEDSLKVLAIERELMEGSGSVVDEATSSKLPHSNKRIFRTYLQKVERTLNSLKTRQTRNEVELQRNQKESEMYRKKVMEIEEEIRPMEVQLEEFKGDITNVLNKWSQEKDKKYTLFVLFQMFAIKSHHTTDPMTEFLMERLATFPTETKLLVTPAPSYLTKIKEIPESLHVTFGYGRGEAVAVVDTMAEVLSKRWKTLDLISIMQEVQRTSSNLWRSGEITVIDNLSCIPRFQKTEEEP